MRLGRKKPLRGWFGRLRPTVQRRLKIAVPYSLAGLAALVGSFLVSDMPDWAYWAPFAVLFVLLEFFAVEVNDRMLQSASVMVAMSDTNGGMFLALTSVMGNKEDSGTYVVQSIETGPFLTMLIFVGAGLAVIPWLTMLSVIAPILA